MNSRACPARTWRRRHLASLRACSTGKIQRGGYIGSDAASQADLTAAFENGLREVGWIPRQNVIFEYRWTGGDLERRRACHWRQKAALRQVEACVSCPRMRTRNLTAWRKVDGIRCSRLRPWRPLSSDEDADDGPQRSRVSVRRAVLMDVATPLRVRHHLDVVVGIKHLVVPGAVSDLEIEDVLACAVH
jgi:hypothetical protein